MSAPSREVVFTPGARADFTSILLYTGERWGERQRDLYSARLIRAFDRLAQYPHLGETRDGLPSGMRAHVVEHHVIYYRSDERVITVIRLLHSTMDVTSILSK